MSPGIILREQKDKGAQIAFIASLLLRNVRLYQIQGFDEENAVNLAEWVLEKYQYEPLEIIISCLETPPATKDRNWRLTPDTIAAWMKIKLEEVAAEREKNISSFKEKQAELKTSEISQQTQKMINDLLQKLKPAPKPREIQKKGNYMPLTVQEMQKKEKHLQYIRENYEPTTGKKNEKWMPEAEWLSQRSKQE